MADPVLTKKLTTVPGTRGTAPPPENAFLQSLRPEDVVHQREQMVRWWSQPGEWQQKFALQGRLTIPGWENKGGVREAEESRKWMAGTFHDAELYWVSPEMTEVITTLAPSIPDCLPQPSPVPDAFVMFAKSVPGTDAETGDTIYTSGILWGTINMFRMGPCIASETYSWRDLVFLYHSSCRRKEQEAVPGDLSQSAHADRWIGVASGVHDVRVRPPTRACSTPMSGKQSMLEDRQLLATFWALASQKIVVETVERPYSRQVQRQAERHGHVLPDVRVIRLREPAGHAPGAGGMVGSTRPPLARRVTLEKSVVPEERPAPPEAHRGLRQGS